MSEKRKIIKTTKSGRIYIETKDFLIQPKVKKTIEILLKSDLIKQIDLKNEQESVELTA